MCDLNDVKRFCTCKNAIVKALKLLGCKPDALADKNNESQILKKIMQGEGGKLLEEEHDVIKLLQIAYFCVYDEFIVKTNEQTIA